MKETSRILPWSPFIEVLVQNTATFNDSKHYFRQSNNYAIDSNNIGWK